jgi:hypothetical protein
MCQKALSQLRFKAKRAADLRIELVSTEEFHLAAELRKACPKTTIKGQT